MLSKDNSGHWMENTVIFRIFHVCSSFCAYFKIMLWSCSWWTVTIKKEFHATWLSTEIATLILSLILFKSNNDELGSSRGKVWLKKELPFTCKRWVFSRETLNIYTMSCHWAELLWKDLRGFGFYFIIAIYF